MKEKKRRKTTLKNPMFARAQARCMSHEIVHSEKDAGERRVLICFRIGT